MGSRTIILPVGISVLRALERHKVHLNPGHEAAQLTDDLLNSLGAAADELSAELATLKALGPTEGEEAAFLATDTDDSERAAKINAIIAERRFRLETTIRRVPKLGLDDAVEFRSKGLPALFQELDRLVTQASDKGHEPLLSVSGGIKPVVPYIAVYGMLRRVPVTYIFERTRKLITLPPLPIDFDWESLQEGARVLRQFEEEVAMERHKVEALLGERFPRLEGLFEEVGDNQLTLSAFGFMLLEDLKVARERPVMLSPSAQKKLEQVHGMERKLLEIMLDRVRSPLWRAHKHHSFQGTDLNVYKPGSTAYRLAGWLEGETVYVAEFYTDHDEYLRDLPNRCREQYRPADFTPYFPSAEAELPVGEEEEQGDELIAIAVREQAQAEAERDAALQLASQYEDELRKKDQEISELRQRVTTLEEEQQARGSWSLWRRLRWALFDKH